MATPPLVGRELDLAVAIEQLKRIDTGSPAALLVRGEAGIGKSRLVAELALRARQLGYTTLLGRADDLDRGIPYATFRDLLARGAPTADAFRTALDIGPGPAGAEADHLPAVFASAVELFRGLADDGPTVLVLEDLHVADPESLALIALLARLAAVPMLTAVTLRPSTAALHVEQLFESMAADGRGAVVDLEPLDRHETQAVVAGAVGATPTEALADAVFDASHGNPFFAGEVVQSFLDGGAVVVDGGRAHLVVDAPAIQLRPSTALLRRVFGGTSVDVELAKVMAVFGRFTLRHLGLVERMSGQSADEVIRSFDRLVKAGVLAASTGGGYEFSHAIVRATLYDDIGPAERRRLHAAIAAELAAEQRAGTLLDLLELATHVAESAEPGDTAAAGTLLDAGRAVIATAPLVAAGYHHRAAELLPVGDPQRAKALAAEARALHLGARPAEAAEVGRRALAALAPGDTLPGTVAIVVNDLYNGGHVHEALELADDMPAVRVNLLFEAGRYDEAAAEFDEALASIDGPPASQLMAITHIVQYANHVGRVDVAADLFDRVEALADSPSPTLRLAVHELLAFADWRPGLVARSDAHLTAAAALRPDPASLSHGGSLEAARTRLHCMRGEWDAALELISRASLELEQRGSRMGAGLLRSAGCVILVDRGDVDAAVRAAALLTTPIAALAREAAMVRARVAVAVGDVDGAESILVAERDAAGAPGASLWRLAEVLAMLVDLRLDEDRVEEARAHVAELDALAERTGWPETRMPALRARARAFADLAAAAAAAELAAAEGWVVEEARAALDLGELDVDPATNLTAAYRAFDSFGAAPWRRRAAAGLRSRGLTVPRRAAQPGSTLTDTEVQLVRLVREGLSNRQIGAAMHYSTKTIEVYLSRLYARTGFASRLELIRAVDAGALVLD